MSEQFKEMTQGGPSTVAVLGTRSVPYLHQPVIELLSYALALSGNHVVTSGSQGTNECVIRGALRAQKPKLLTVILPQGFKKQEEDVQSLLYACMESGANVIEAPENDSMPPPEALELCNARVLNRVKKIIVFSFHNSKALLKCVEEAKDRGLITTVLFLD
ncbi:unnamed protein product [Effrenium voratum]|uniref:Uncharacterized protein n=1 Tax=Effrenium voratum TaxID=2562239 RepID=A0AA36IB32_9DINO|nr:unnamed protein product [Effrenium voratum]